MLSIVKRFLMGNQCFNNLLQENRKNTHKNQQRQISFFAKQTIAHISQRSNLTTNKISY